MYNTDTLSITHYQLTLLHTDHYNKIETWLSRLFRLLYQLHHRDRSTSYDIWRKFKKKHRYTTVYMKQRKSGIWNPKCYMVLIQLSVSSLIFQDIWKNNKFAIGDIVIYVSLCFQFIFFQWLLTTQSPWTVK